VEVTRIIRKARHAWHDYRRKFNRWSETRRNKVRTPKKVFEEIYQKNAWGGSAGELFSGVGSRHRPAELYIATVSEFIARHNLKTVLDLGCGDFEIGRRLAAHCHSYIGVDVVPQVIERHSARFANERVRFLCLDITSDELPDADLCLIRQVLQHMSNEQIQRVLSLLRKFPHVLVTEHYPHNVRSYNRNIVHGSGTRVEEFSAVFLDKPPFNAKSLELLLEVHPFVPNSKGEPEPAPDWGYLRTYRVQV
jgi:SAM-dependent methyltransferase